MKRMPPELVPKTVDDYLKSLPVDIENLLRKVRVAIKAAAPKAEEVISYNIPTYKLSGPLVHFAAFKDHCSFVFVSKTIPEQFKKELEPFDVKGRTLHFSPENPLPATLIKKIVKARVAENLDNGIRKGKRASLS
jgi:uncharacterized protein YdhG (YjbR/CyaY superfamily)